MAQGVDSSLVIDRYVSNDGQLRTAVNEAVGLGRPFVIALDRNIALLGSTLVIPAGADVTLISNNEITGSSIDFFRLYGVNGASTITVNNGGTLRLVGIIVTHVPGNGGLGVIVNSGGELILSDGVISGNAVGSSSGGCGVYIYGGSFVMAGGVISSNTNGASGGGGVFVSSGSFELLGGVISDNTAVAITGGYNWFLSWFCWWCVHWCRW